MPEDYLLNYLTSATQATPVVKDLAAYLEADARVCALYADPDAWARKAILNVGSSGKFSSDRTIAEYAAEIWHVKSCPVS